MAGFEINRGEMKRMARQIQQEFDKHAISVPIYAERLAVPSSSPATTVIYNGPVIYGHANGVQLAWNNNEVTQNRLTSQQIAPDFESIAQAVAKDARPIGECRACSTRPTRRRGCRQGDSG